jgi:hypothetical protein
VANAAPRCHEHSHNSACALAPAGGSNAPNTEGRHWLTQTCSENFAPADALTCFPSPPKERGEKATREVVKIFMDFDA